MKDKEIGKLIKLEENRQKKMIDLIASENIVSNDVLEALGSKLTNKYSEGYPGHRYYGGQEFTDKIENLAIKRALKLFKLSPEKWHVNVQPLSGSPANVAVYLATVPVGGKIMGMSLSHGGHLTHGHKVSISGKVWQQVAYGVDAKTEQLNYAEIAAIAEKEKPALIVAGFTAYPRVIDFKKFREIADSVGALLMVDMSHFAGLVAGGVYPVPFEYADIVTTTVHKTLRGPRSALIFARNDEAGATGKIGAVVPREHHEGTNVFVNESMSLGKKIDKAVFPGMQGGPHMNQIAAVAVALREAAAPEFKKYAKQIVKNATTLADTLSKLGWRIVSGGTDSHLILVDTWMAGKGISGSEASARLEKAGIIVNKNGIPFDTRPPTDPSGIRVGSAAETTRGAKEKDFRAIAKRIDEILRK